MIAGAEERSYAALHARADGLARLLTGRVIGPEQVVGLCLPRSPVLVEAVLATLKAGGAFLPLDPEHSRSASPSSSPMPPRPACWPPPRSPPACRRQHRCCCSTIPTQCPAHSAAGCATRRCRPLRPGNPAYLIYTAGSTGKPKAVTVAHAAITNHTLWLNQQFDLGPQDRVLRKTPVTFDASVWEFISTLTSGATLILARPGGHGDPDYLSALMLEQRITVLQMVPSLLSAMLEQPAFRSEGSLRLLCCGGRHCRRR